MNLSKIMTYGFALVWLILGPFTGVAEDLQRFYGVEYLPAEGDDGDSFKVRLDDEQVRLRLYFVDTPEMSVSWDSDVRRIQEQQRYFGLSNELMVIELGRQAADRTARLLQEPFTVYTAFASALGRSAHGRIYGFVELKDGRDLGRVLIEEGLARSYGIGRAHPAGISRDEYKEQLNDAEVSAMLARKGIWAYADSGQIATLRADQRREDALISSMKQTLNNGSRVPDSEINMNRATAQDLRQLNGVGPVTADRIIAGRPYTDINDLAAVSGISARMIDTWRPYISIE